MDIEVELRSFISKQKYDELLEFFRKEAEFVNDDVQETHYFDAKEDVRIQRNNFFSKIWLKKGKLHDEHREEIEIKFDKNDFGKIARLFTILGFNVSIKWFRKRHTYNWQEISVMIDDTRGYGHIIELEKMSDEQNKDKTLQLLKQKFALLNIPITPREEFDKRFTEYKENWRELVAPSSEQAQ